MRLKKIIASSLMIASIMVLNPIAANAEWKQDNTGWWYTEGNSWAIGWKQIDGKWYYFDSNGYMAHDTKIGQDYLGSDGAWVNSNDTTKTSSGYINKNTSIQSISKNDFQLLNNKGKGYNSIDSLKDETRGYSVIVKRKTATNNQEEYTTFRNIHIGDSVDAIQKAYGSANIETSADLINRIDEIDRLEKYSKDWDFNYKLQRYINFNYSEGNNSYKLRFYLDDNNKVNFVIYTKNI